MEELWTVKFTLMMRDLSDNTPSVDGDLLIRGTDIFSVLEKAKIRLDKFGFDHVIIHGAHRCTIEKEGEN